MRPGTIDERELEGCARLLRELAADRYEIVRPIARGGMSVVLLGWDRMEGRHVALKLLDPQREFPIEDRERFRREALISARLAHPHIVPCFDFLHHGGHALAVMRYVPGQSLAERLEGDRRLPLAQVMELLLQLSDALDLAHRNGVVHRDVKPANILLHSEGDWPFLTDFGIATLRTSEHSRSEVGKGFGTPAFMSPEQALGRWDADYRTDIYSLGLVGYRALAGRLPFTGETDISLAVQRTVRDAPPLRQLAPAVPAALAAVIDRCLARNPARRWRDCRALRRALVRCAAGRPAWIERLSAAWLAVLPPAQRPRWAEGSGTPAPMSR